MISGLPSLTVSNTADSLRRREISSVELTRYCIDRIERFDPTLHSFVTLDSERALREAAAADAEIARGDLRSTLHGVPYALKDVYDAQGFPTTGCSPAFRYNEPAHDAATVAKLRDAGAILLGKLTTHELTYGGVDTALPWPPARNPWDPARDPGGSSSGSGVAVAAGFCAFALGTDTGGSVRNPAALCGIVGLKPTYGLVSRSGVLMNSYSLDHCGPMTWTARDCATVLQVVAGFDPGDPASADRLAPNYSERLGKSIRGMRIGVISHFYQTDIPAPASVHESMKTAISVLEELGAVIEEVRLRPVAAYATPKVTIQLPEIYSLYGERTKKHPEDFGPKFRARIASGDRISAVDYVAAQKIRRELTAEMAGVLDGLDVLVTSGPYPASLLEESAAIGQLNRVEITVPFSMTGFPAISVCSGFTREGLPLSMQIAGRPFEDDVVLHVADAYEQVTPWHTKRPRLEEIEKGPPA